MILPGSQPRDYADESQDAYTGPRSALLPPLTPQDIVQVGWVIPALVCAAIFTTGAFCGIVAVGGVALGWW